MDSVICSKHDHIKGKILGPLLRLNLLSVNLGSEEIINLPV